MTDKNQSSLSPSLSIGGVSSLAILLANQFFDPKYTETVTVGIPILIGVLFFAFEYAYTIFNVPSLAEIKVTSKLDRTIQYLEKRITIAKNSGRSIESIKKLEAELEEAELARAKVHTLFADNESNKTQP
ncbi:hypothetical protein [Vibrio harveyi]|uniref:hypothetical protein n=1 Tax=Vibrio harveyi TaxID=669 RepID=UPI000682FED2|nr:hypothetical protein [Vibrio harveyi]